MANADAGLSDDAALGGRLVLRQPRRGHRFGHDSILLAAATPARRGERAIELGAGIGAAGLALASRVEELNLTLVEIDPELTALSRHNAERNGLSARVRAVCLDVTAPAAAFAAAGLAPGSADRVLMNPPFNALDNASPDSGRRLARVGAPDTLSQWLGTAARLLAPGGTVTVIWRADGLAAVIAALAEDFGALSLLPIHPKPGAGAIRIIATAAKERNAPLALLPGLLLAGDDGKPSAAAESVLRQGAALPMAIS